MSFQKADFKNIQTLEGEGGKKETHWNNLSLHYWKQNSLYKLKLNGILELRIEQGLHKASCGNDDWRNLAKKKGRILKAGDTTK